MHSFEVQGGKIERRDTPQGAKEALQVISAVLLTSEKLRLIISGYMMKSDQVLGA
jgi:hypothetical protein